jgi:hypothetical protein
MFINKNSTTKTPASDRIKALTESQEIHIEKRLLESFENGLTTFHCSPQERKDLETLLIKMMKTQSPQADLDRLSLSYFSEQELIITATHMYMACIVSEVLNKSKETQNYIEYFHHYFELDKAYQLGNPFIIRFHIFSLGARIDEINKMFAGSMQKDEIKIALLSNIVNELKDSIDKMASHNKQHYCFNFYLQGVGYYLLSSAYLEKQSPIYNVDMGKKYLCEALIDLHLSESYADKSPRDIALMTMGAGLFAETFLKDFAFSKKHIEELGYLDQKELKRTLDEYNRRAAVIASS